MEELFWPLSVAAFFAVASALGVVLAPRPMHGAVALLAHSLAIAALFFLLSAELVAVGQILIYSGAIVVLFLFVVALLPSGGSERFTVARVVAAGAGAAALLAALAAVYSGARLPQAPPTAEGGARAVGQALFGPLLVAFELTAPLLLVAIVGAVLLWRRQEGKE